MRKKLLSLVVAISLFSLTGCGGGSDAAAEASLDNDYAGTTLYMIAEQSAPTEALKNQLAEFTSLTGITVELETAPFDDVVQKETLAFESKSGAYDIVASPYQFLGNMVENGYIQSLEPLMNNKELAIIEDYDHDDVIAGMLNASGDWKGELYGVPSNSCIMFFAYRQDLYEDTAEQQAFKEKYGYELAVPEDWDTYKDIAEFFTREKGETLAGEELSANFYGVSMSGKRHDATTCEWLNYLWSFGGGIFDDEGNIAIDNEQAVAALDYYMGLIPYAPEGVTAKTWDEQTTEMQQGVAAMAVMFNDCAPALEEESSSLVAGKMGYAAIPVKTEPAAHYGAWGYYIPTDSKNPEAAWIFMQWFNTPKVQKAIAQEGCFPNLTSVYEDPDLQDIPYWEASMDAYEISTTRPRIQEWNAMNEALMLELSNAITGGKTSAQALEDCAASFAGELEGQLPVTYQ